MSMERVLCSKCGASILPATFERTKGFCMPCWRTRELPAALESDPNAECWIVYSVNPSWGRCRRVYLLTVGEEAGLLHFQSGTDLPDTLRWSARDSLRIFPEYPVSTKRLESASCSMLRDYVEALTLPVLGEFTGGFDGTNYLLGISRGRTVSEFRWWMDLPERWLPLLEIVSFMAKPFATSDFDDSNPKRTDLEPDEALNSPD